MHGMAPEALGCRGSGPAPKHVLAATGTSPAAAAGLVCSNPAWLPLIGPAVAMHSQHQMRGTKGQAVLIQVRPCSCQYGWG